MAELTHRQRVATALSHQEPDRVPIDFGGRSLINTRAYSRLAKHLGLDDEVRRAGLRDPSDTIVPCEELMDRFGSDFRRVPLSPPDYRTQEQLDERTRRNEWGVTSIRPEDGHYLPEMGPFQKELPTVADMDRHPWPDFRDPERVRGLGERAQKLHEETDYAVMLALNYGVVRECQRMRGFGEWMEDLLLNPAIADALMDRVTDVSVGIAQLALEQAGPHVDVVNFPDDMGFQDRSYVRQEVYRQRIKPYHRRLVEAIKSRTDAKVLMHSDGSVYDLIPDFIDIGVDALNPVQVSAKDMGSARLKAEFGDHLSVWGAIDTQGALPFGSTDDVVAEVRTRIGDLAPGGGYVLGSVHNILAEVSPENIVAMFEAALEHGRYGQPAPA